MATTDDTDQKLISLLRSNARLPVVDLARKLGLSRATVQNRMNRLERTGIIINYTINVKAGAELNPVRALVSIAADAKKEARAIELLAGMPEVVSIHHTTGRWDIIAEIRTDTLETFNRVVGEIRFIDGISMTETNLLLDSMEYGTPVLINV
ncbi:Lrp/AsnC family transcriptional regulator [Kineobactrum salinum]|uniref:Lrp/AsnC family transcriptional regulator n=1 Tax=Kineobactrum salinum TaxID=2708301 RepID=A0A6C0U4H8_9GAMM|nr:Lrp/AsnC family transcriptional regulator [Kineobactrum salinum]QIB64354.1 Lrp/AsnC family transcriptional regulator [Kineobactrum salinum]